MTIYPGRMRGKSLAHKAAIELARMTGKTIAIIGLNRRIVMKPRPLQSFFDTGECPDCGRKEWSQYQDGGHDRVIVCGHCDAHFGIRGELIEKVK